MKRPAGVTVALAMALALTVTARGPAARAQAARFDAPAVMLWAWERPEDLGFLRSIAPERRPGVAFLARTVHLAGDAVREEPRRQPLVVPDETFLVAVVRVEGARRYARASHAELQRARIVEALRAASRLPGVRAVQLDYDALVSERVFYRSVLDEARRALPAQTALTMTALASWCAFDRWIDEAPALPVHAVVPMLFTMGARGTRELAEFVRREGDLASPRCATDVGYAAHEPTLSLREGSPARRVWWFNPAPWNAGQFAAVTARWSTHRGPP